MQKTITISLPVDQYDVLILALEGARAAAVEAAEDFERDGEVDAAQDAEQSAAALDGLLNLMAR